MMSVISNMSPGSVTSSANSCSEIFGESGSLLSLSLCTWKSLQRSLSSEDVLFCKSVRLDLCNISSSIVEIFCNDSITSMASELLLETCLSPDTAPFNVSRRVTADKNEMKALEGAPNTVATCVEKSARLLDFLILPGFSVSEGLLMH